MARRWSQILFSGLARKRVWCLWKIEILPVLSKLQAVSTTSPIWMFLKPDHVELGSNEHKATFFVSCVSSAGRIGWGKFYVKKWQREWGLIGAHAYKMMKTNKLRSRDFVWLHFFDDLIFKLLLNSLLDFPRNWQAPNPHDVFGYRVMVMMLIKWWYLVINLRAAPKVGDLSTWTVPSLMIGALTQ